MKRLFFAACLTVVSCLGAGCKHESIARTLVAPNTGGGKLAIRMAGTGEQLIKGGKIDTYRRVKAPDGTEIDVWVIKAKQADKTESTSSKGTVVVLHSLGKCKADFPFFGIGERLAKMGYDVVLPDLRHHGRSGGNFITYGAKEKHDVKAVVDALLSEGLIGPDVYVFGDELGGTVAIQYAAIDPRCKGVMAVTAYQDFRTISRRSTWCWAMSDEDFEKVLAIAGKTAKFDPAEASAVEAAKKLRCPLLLVHGLLNMSIPLSHSEAIYKAAPQPKKLIVLTAEQIILPAYMEDWIAEKIDMLARTGLAEEPKSP
ncbi:MAG: alpha/beta fold hydrolase [Phycisphaerae bacterium]|nr:alpha/beta fold hydrolase [Phycisphaerae bacterium]